MAARKFFQVWWETQEGITNGSRKFENLRDARRLASELDEYVILKRSQETRGESKVWTDLNVEIVEGDFWDGYLDEITDVEVKN